MPAEGGKPLEVLVVGAGPAGLAAAVAAAESGASVRLVDDNLDLGGQIWRGERAGRGDARARRLIDRLMQTSVRFLPGTRVVGLAGRSGLLVASDAGCHELGYSSLVLATGARERFLPFPGWTLPNVLGAGGLQALAKSGLPVSGKRVVVAGSGPLLLAVAASLASKGAHVAAVAEQAPLARLVPFGLQLGLAPAKLVQALGLRVQLGSVPYRAGTWPVEAEGSGQVQRVTLSNGRKTWTYECDYLACGFGLVPNLELARLLGCEVGEAGTRVDERQETSVPGVFAAGESTGVAGLDQALLEGEIAGLAAAGSQPGAGLIGRRDRGRGFARRLERSFALRDELRDLARPDTVVCRCEDVPASELLGRSGWVDAKLQTRCGMGPCQGRICGAALAFLRGWPAPSVRPPLFPVPVASLASPTVEACQDR
jgi:NADPH-dependent 2,4-dienoyl-CoA reductase/sulfur reductase-like enzyme